jgi:hypothetical protein
MSKVTAIDWTQPIQWASNVFPDWKDVTFLGEYNNQYGVIVNHGATGPIVHWFTEDGYPWGCAHNNPFIRNTPPKKTAKRWVVMNERGDAWSNPVIPSERYVWDQCIIAVKEVTITEGEGMHA